jgi:serine/threonine protein kinase/tetratricopeptide (TPR) repeat protein
MTDKQTNETGVGFEPGTKIGKYEVAERLAMGGQAIIYKCHDPLLDRHVAIKQISSHLAEDEKFLERFRKEAQILARLGAEQPAIVTIHEMIEEEKGLFIVMEFVNGPTLEQVLRDTQGPTETKAVLQILWRMAAALHDVHAAGIIHRDLKPSNIIIAEGLHPKIADFGIAASTTGQTSMMLGTTKYMAPELYGDEAVDGRADMYSLGFMMYELLVGRPKFEEAFSDVVRDRHSETLRWMKWHGNKDASAPPIRELNPDVPEGLAHIVMKMIAKDPRERYENMEALGRAIKIAFSSKGKRSKPAPSGGRKARKRSGAGAAAGGAGAAPTAPDASVDPEMSLDDSGILPVDEPTPQLGAQPATSAGQTGTATAQPSRDELELDEPATAPIPKSSFSRKKKILLAVVVGLAIVVLGVGLAVMGRGEEENRAQKIARLYENATEAYDAGKYAKAAESFEELVSRYPRSNAARRGGILMHLAKGRVAVSEKDWNQAAKEKQAAREELINVQRDAQGDLLEWTRAIEPQISQFEDFYTNVRRYDEAVERVEAMIADGRFQDARTELRAVGRTIGSGWPGFQKRHQQLLDHIDRLEFMEKLNEAVVRADELAEADRFAEAKDAYDKAIDILEDDNRARLIDQSKRAERMQYLTARHDEMESYRAYTEAMAEANKARDSGSRARELEWLKEAAKVKKTDTLVQRIKKVESDYYLQVANRALSDGQQSQAKRLYEKALEINPDNQRAKSALESLEKNARYASLVAAGDTAMVAREWDKALEKYMAARKIDSTQELNEKIVTCQFRIQLAKANKLREQGEYEKAKTAYEKAAAIKESEAAMVESLQVSMAQEVQYKELMAKAKALLEQGSYKQAIEQFEKAGKVYATAPEAVEEGIRRAKYEINMALGREALAEGDPTGAKAYFRLAQAQLDTAEVRKALADLGDVSPE